jgi:hypothetical protein
MDGCQDLKERHADRLRGNAQPSRKSDDRSGWCCGSIGLGATHIRAPQGATHSRLILSVGTRSCSLGLGALGG